MNNQLTYEGLRIEDRDDSSTTDVEESLMGDEKQMDGKRCGKGHKRKSKSVTCLHLLQEARWFLDIGLLLIIIGLLLRDQSQKAHPKTSENEVGGDFTGVGPHCKSYQAFGKHRRRLI